MKRILVRLPNWVGDAIMATPLLRGVRNYFPEAAIDLLGRATLRPLFDGLPYFDAFYPVETGLFGRVRTASLLRRQSYDCALILPHSIGAALPIVLAGIPRRIGYNRYPGQRWLLTDPLPVAFDEAGRFVPTPMHEHYLGLLRALGGSAGADPWPAVALADAARTRVEALCERQGIAAARFIVVNPAASFGSSKHWTPQAFAAVGDVLSRETGARIVVVAGPGEREVGREILAQMRCQAVDLCDPPLALDELNALIVRCAMLVTVDSGPRHLAVAARRPVVVVMGPTDPRYTHLCLDQTAIVRLEGLYCLGCHYKTCPTEHECMRMLHPEAVVEAALRLWERTYALPESSGSTSEPPGEAFVAPSDAL